VGVMGSDQLHAASAFDRDRLIPTAFATHVCWLREAQACSWHHLHAMHMSSHGMIQFQVLVCHLRAISVGP